MPDNRFYLTSPEQIGRFINRWDLFLLTLLFLVFFFLGWAGSQMASPYQLGDPSPISLDPKYLSFLIHYKVENPSIALSKDIIEHKISLFKLPQFLFKRKLSSAVLPD